MLEMIAWEILVLGALCAWLIARTRSGQGAVLCAALILGGLLLAQGQTLRTQAARAQNDFNVEETLRRSRALVDDWEAPVAPPVTDPKVQAWLNRRVSEQEFQAALKAATSPEHKPVEAMKAPHEKAATEQSAP